MQRLQQANPTQEKEARTTKRTSGNPLYLGLTARSRPTPTAPAEAAAAAPTSLAATSAVQLPVSSPLSVTFREHMDTARQRWTSQQTGEAGIAPRTAAPIRRPASATHWTPTATAAVAENGYEHSIAATIAPSPPVRPASSYTQKRSTAAATASARPSFAHSPAPRSAATAAVFASSAALPLRANLTHVAKAGVSYAGELFYPFGHNDDPFDPECALQQQQEQQHHLQPRESEGWDESKDHSISGIPSARRPSIVYTHRPVRYYRGWVKCVPPRDDQEEERIYARNVARGIVPPLKTITAQAIRHQPMGRAGSALATGATSQRPKSAAAAVGSSSRLHQLQQQQSAHVAAVLASNALVAARWASQSHMSHTEIHPPFAPLTIPLPAADRGDDSRHPSSPSPPPLLDDKNEFDAQRLLRARRGATTEGAADGGGLSHELAYNAAPPAGRLNPSGFYRGPLSREFSSLFPASADFGGPVPQGLYVSEAAARFGPVDPRRVAINLALARRGPGARVVEMDARAKANHRMGSLMRGNYHQQSKLKKDKSGRAYEG